MISDQLTPAQKAARASVPGILRVRLGFWRRRYTSGRNAPWAVPGATAEGGSHDPGTTTRRRFDREFADAGHGLAVWPAGRHDFWQGVYAAIND